MITDVERQMDRFYLSYKKILYRFKVLNIKTRSGKEITSTDLRRAIEIMIKKHPTCRWKRITKRKNEYCILIEGYYWLQYVYFQTNKKQIDADIDFFLERINQYEKLLSVKKESFWERDYYIYELETYFNRSHETIKKAISKMNKATNRNYRYIKNNQCIISKLGVEWLCKKCFKHKYLELLEAYKMELTEKYMEAGYPYDNF